MKYIFAFTLFSLTLSPVAVQAENHPGKALIDNSCQRCHDNAIYTREKSILHSFPDLQARVEFCESASGHAWSSAQRGQVIDYLNQTFYHFPAQSK